MKSWIEANMGMSFPPGAGRNGGYERRQHRESQDVFFHRLFLRKSGRPPFRVDRGGSC